MENNLEERYLNTQKIYNDSQPIFDEVKIAKKTQRKGSFYDGTVLGLMGCAAVKIVLAVLLPWAECIVADYNYSHTVYSGKRLKFEGKGGLLFIEKFKWIFLSVITFGIYGIWIPVRKQQWYVSNLHFEDEMHIRDESIFTGTVLGTFGVNLFCVLLTILSLGLLYPFAICYKEKWLFKHTIINKKRLVFTGTGLDLIGHWLLWILLTIITFGIYGFWIPLKIEEWKAKNTHIKLINEPEVNVSTVPMIIGAVLLVLFASILFIIMPLITSFIGSVNFYGNPMTQEKSMYDSYESYDTDYYSY